MRSSRIPATSSCQFPLLHRKNSLRLDEFYSKTNLKKTSGVHVRNGPSFPLSHQLLCCVPEWGRWKKKRGLVRGHCRLCGDASGFFLSRLATLKARHDWTFWIRGSCKWSIWGDMYIQTYIYDIYTYDIRYPSLGGFFFWGGNLQYNYVYEGGNENMISLPWPWFLEKNVPKMMVRPTWKSNIPSLKLT